MRAAEMNMKKTHLPIEEQNYDPMIPYMAPCADFDFLPSYVSFKP